MPHFPALHSVSLHSLDIPGGICSQGVLVCTTGYSRVYVHGVLVCTTGYSRGYMFTGSASGYNCFHVLLVVILLRSPLWRTFQLL